MSPSHPGGQIVPAATDLVKAVLALLVSALFHAQVLFGKCYSTLPICCIVGVA